LPWKPAAAGHASGGLSPQNAAALIRVIGSSSLRHTWTGWPRTIVTGGRRRPAKVTTSAFDLGGGNRFDLGENRSLGRAYLARLYRRYGNWPDAIAAYNWGLGNLDAWIGDGRPASRLPLEVEHYRDRVLRETGLPTASLASAPPGK
jgi:hypothetical protein